MKKYWFVRKRYGWGWTPASWQGWAILGVYTGGIAAIVGNDRLGDFFLQLIGLTVVLLVITFLTGEKPRWQWGKDKESLAKDD